MIFEAWYEPATERRPSNRAAPSFRMPPLDDMQTDARLRFLHHAVTSYGRKRTGAALEIGCFKGASTVVLAQACRSIGLTRLTSVDLFTGTPDWGQTFDTYADASRRMREFGVAEFVRLVRGDSRTVTWSAPIDVLHIDGDHSLEAVRSDISRFVPHLAPAGIVLFDDYDPSHPGVMSAVDEFLSGNEAFQILERHDSGPAGGSLCVGRR